ncbi:MAG: DNA/RNA non-specific endonuclease [Saprospiraceae bacterium]|jgi:endonuclease G|nr:DNA/RNA non-specific endonuclease [Saprospiraceae bacterium]MBL0027083.1 DNA/RNA non-specific endonuclease [Saprospiraceae bacterium]
MAKFRQNHQRQSNGLQTSFRLVVVVIICILAFVGVYIYFNNNITSYISEVNPYNDDHSLRTFLPSSHGEVIDHTYYSLSYIEKNEQAEWTAYTMDRNMLNVPNLPRYNYFEPDYKVSTGSATDRDYTNSGYTRGHLVPAGDMAFDTLAMRESFLMSNMSPQLRSFNNGIWKELEENIRDWTYKAVKLYIITGPVFNGTRKTIGKENKIAVPNAFFKVVLDYTDPERKGIGFIIPNQVSDQRLEEFMVTIDQVELMTGLDFFNDMINDVEEEKLESTIDKSKWKVSEKSYQLRISKWNFE